MSGRPFRIDFIADFCCPWCYVGWRALDRAIAARTDLDVRRTWGAYFLRPDTPPFGFDRVAYMKKRFADQPDVARAARDALVAAADALDAPLNLEAAQIVPNTMNAHRLVHWATGQGRLDAAVEALFAAYFVEGRNIGDAAELTSIAIAIGLDGDLIGNLLQGEADWSVMAEAHNAAVEAGVRGVPVAIFNGKRAHQGAETAAGYARLISAAEAA